MLCYASSQNAITRRRQQLFWVFRAWGRWPLGKEGQTERQTAGRTDAVEGSDSQSAEAAKKL